MTDSDTPLDLGEIEPGEIQYWGPRTPDMDCMICNPYGHIGCCQRRCAFHTDAPDPLPDRAALTKAQDDYRKWSRVEMDARRAYEDASEKRAAAARRITELGGKV